MLGGCEKFGLGVRDLGSALAIQWLEFKLGTQLLNSPFEDREEQHALIQPVEAWRCQGPMPKWCWGLSSVVLNGIFPVSEWPFSVSTVGLNGINGPTL